MDKNGEIKAIVFDLSDTLIKTWEDGFRKLELVAKKMNLSSPKLETFKQCFASYCGFERTMKKLFGERVDADEVKRVYRSEEVTRLVPRHLVNERIPEMLKDLRLRDFRLAILSNDPEETIIPKIKLVGLDFDYFEVVLGANEKVKVKPEIGCFDRLLRLMNLDKDEFIYLGDSLVDFEACRVNKVRNFVAVNSGLTEDKMFREAGYRGKIYDDVVAWWKEWRKEK